MGKSNQHFIEPAFDSGYSLLEVLVALAISTSIMVLGYSALQGNLQVWRSSDTIVTRQEILNPTRSFLKYIVESAYPFAPGRSDRILVYPFVGGTHEIKFTAPLSASGINNALYRIALWFDSNDQSLKVTWVPDGYDIDDPRDETNKAEEVLFSSVNSVEFSYLDDADVNVRRRWVQDWKRKAGLPVAVKLDIKLGDVETKLWSPMVIFPKITASADCKFDAVSRSCRRVN